MKNLYKYVFMGILALGLGSCDDDEENNTVVVQDTVETGAVLRTISFTDELLLDIDPQQFVVELEEQDEFEGALLESVNLYVTYTDNSTIAGNSSSINTEEVLLRNVPASEFAPGPFGLPRVTLTVPLAEILTAIGGTSDGIYVDDTFLFREELILTDGRVFSVDNAGGIITAGFFNSPFQHLQTITGGLDLAFSDEGSNEVNLATSEGGYSATTAVIEAVEDLWTEGEIFVQYVDNNDEDATDFSTDEVSISTFTRAMFTAVMDEDGNVIPEATDEDGNVLGFQLESMFDFDLATISAGVDITDMTIGDEIRLRYSLTNSSGRAISSTGEPFTVVIPVVTCELPPLPEGFFTGAYEIEQVAGVGPFDATFGPQYGTQDITVMQDPNDSDVRTFVALLHPGPQGFDFEVFCTVDINCGQFLYITDGGAAAGGTLSCDMGQSTVIDSNPAIPSVISIEEGDDESFQVVISGFGIDDGGCDNPPYDITLQFTKQ